MTGPQLTGLPPGTRGTPLVFAPSPPATTLAQEPGAGEGQERHRREPGPHAVPEVPRTLVGGPIAPSSLHPECRLAEMLEKLQLRRGVPQVFEKIFHLADTPGGQILAALQDEEVGDLLPQALRVPDRRRYIRHVVLGAYHGKHAGDAYGAKVVEADRVFEENSLRSRARGRSWRMVFDRLYDRLARLRGEIPVLEDTAGHHRRPLGVVRRLPQSVGFVEPDIV